jgi:hypothetical protein
MADSRWWKDFDVVLEAAVPAGSRILDAGCGDVPQALIRLREA